MKKSTEISLKNSDEFVETIDNEILPLRVGDKFYFSFRGTTPKSEHDYKKEHKIFPTHILNGVIDEINKKAHEYHIKHYVVTKRVDSIKIDHHISISPREEECVRCITVKEVKSPLQKNISRWWHHFKYNLKRKIDLR